MSGPAQIVILGEDAAHVGSLYRAMVDHFGIPSGKVRKLPVGNGRGDAKRHVLRQVPGQIALLRRGPRSAALVIAVDGDGADETRRIREVSDALRADGMNAINADDRVVIVVPCRNAETWLRFVQCTTVDEETNYKQGRRSMWTRQDFELVGRALGQVQPPKANPPPSLDNARARLRETFAERVQ